MSVSKILENIPWSPFSGATGPKCNFFFKFATRSLVGGARVQGEPVAPPPTGDRGLSPPPSGDRVIPLYISIILPFPPHLSPKIPPKIQKKRGVRRREAAKPCRIAHL